MTITCTTLVTKLCNTFRKYGNEVNEIGQGHWTGGLLADENSWNKPFELSWDRTFDNMSLTHRTNEYFHGNHLCTFKNRQMVEMLDQSGIYFMLQNLLFYSPNADFAVFALLMVLEAKGGTILLDEDIVPQSALVSLLFMIMWPSADAHDSLPFSAVHESPMVEYYLLFMFCTESVEQFKIAESAINPEMIDLCSDAPLDELWNQVVGEKYTGAGTGLPVPATNYMLTGPVVKAKRTFVEAFIPFCIANATAMLTVAGYSDLEPRLSVTDCKLEPLPFKRAFYATGLSEEAQRCVWTVLLSTARNQTTYRAGDKQSLPWLPEEIVLLVCYFTTTFGTFDPPRARTDSGDEVYSEYDGPSEPETDDESD